MSSKKDKKLISVKKKRDIDLESDESSDSDNATEQIKHNKKIDIDDIVDSDSSGSDTSGSSSSEEFDIIKKKNTIALKEKPVKNSNEIFKELIKHQLPDVPTLWKLNINDMKRICKYITTSIFDENNCCIWNGYITNMNNSNKGTYVNFYFRNKKVALHRLLYSNFVAPLDSSEYLKFNCDNKGICCNINHYEKYKYSKNNMIAKKDQKHKESKKEIKDIVIIGSDDPDKLIIDFD